MKEPCCLSVAERTVNSAGLYLTIVVSMATSVAILLVSLSEMKDLLLSQMTFACSGGSCSRRSVKPSSLGSFVDTLVERPLTNIIRKAAAFGTQRLRFFLLISWLMFERYIYFLIEDLNFLTFLPLPGAAHAWRYALCRQPAIHHDDG